MSATPKNTLIKNNKFKNKNLKKKKRPQANIILVQKKSKILSQVNTQTRSINIPLISANRNVQWDGMLKQNKKQSDCTNSYSILDVGLAMRKPARVSQDKIAKLQSQAHICCDQLRHFSKPSRNETTNLHYLFG